MGVAAVGIPVVLTSYKVGERRWVEALARPLLVNAPVAKHIYIAEPAPRAQGGPSPIRCQNF